MTIAVTNLKGGVGKTTIATNIAVGFAHLGHKVCIVDTDLGQQSSMEWSGNRPEKELRIPVFGVTSKQLTKEIEILKLDYDFIIIDGTPQLTELAERTILASDLLIIPLLPSIYDFRGFEKFLARYEQVKTLKEMNGGNVRAMVILNRVVPNTIISKDIKEAILDYEDVELLETKIVNRIAYADTPTLGLGVIEYKDRKAKNEVESLITEIQSKLQQATAI